MISSEGERAIQDALGQGRALLKFITPNDVGATGSHQSGYYLPKKIWRHFTPYGPVKGRNDDHPVSIVWQDGRITSSVVKWYGVGTRSEYRITRFGRGFPWLSDGNIGNLLVLVPHASNLLNAYVLSTDEDFSEIQVSLGIEVLASWAFYERGITAELSEDECLNQRFQQITAALESMPEGRKLSSAALDAVSACAPGFDLTPPDEQIVRLMKEEYRLYQLVESKQYLHRVQRIFTSIEDFITTANSILNSRKSRAGRSLENHVEFVLKRAGIPFEMRQTVDGTTPDVVVPGRFAYEDPNFDIDKIFIVGLKTTCKDRWRQVTQEAPRIPHKHIITLQEGISEKQIDEMTRANVSLVVPESLHVKYPATRRNMLTTLKQFITSVKDVYPS
jgi:hypothetical protein